MKKIFHILFIQGVLILAVSLLSIAAFAQQASQGNNTIKMAANNEYDKSGKIKRFMFGDHYRKEWATPVDVEILDMETFAGGLTPIKMGGGLQTKSLRLKGADGNEYVLRSVNKDPAKAIPVELRETVAEDIVQDQISSSNPYAPMVVASLAEAAGIFHSTPKLVYVTKSNQLGEYANTFGETLCLIEQRPSGNEENSEAFGFSKNVVNTEKLLEKVFSNSNHQVDEKAFLKARLFDLLIGDWDRHEDQWLWAAFKEDGRIIYKPIPRDRDQAFSRLDGVIPHMATQKWMIRKVKDFDYTIHDVNGLNINGGHLDRNFTTRLTSNDWIVVAKELQTELTDAAIAAAFKEMPAAIYNISGRETEAKLKGRRNDLQKYAISYYKFLAEQVNITGTKDQEIFNVTRINDGSTSVIVYKAANADAGNRIIFQRTFLRSETKEIRLYGLAGNDIFNLNGETKKGILIRVIGGKGEDSLSDNSSVAGLSHQTKVYDDENNNFNKGKETRLHISSDSLKNEYNRKAFVNNWLAPFQSPGYNADDGLLINGKIIYKKQGFGKAPYASMQMIGGSYAFSTSAYSIWYKGIFKEFIGKSDLHIAVKYNSPTYTRNYYGLGNETINRDDVSKDYYRVRMSQFSFSSSMNRQLGKYHTISIGNEFQWVKLQESENRYVTSSSTKLDSSDFTSKKFTNLQFNYQFNTVDNPLYPRKGIQINAGARYTQNIDENEQNFVQLYSEAAFYTSKGRFTLASRTGIATNTGDKYEFYQANSLGGLTNLRGFRRDRYAGKTSVYQNTELRVSMGNMNAYVIKGGWGLLAFTDHGKVWMPNEESDIWHYGYGGGLWLLPFNKMAMTATYGVSKEGKLISVSAGFLF